VQPGSDRAQFLKHPIEVDLKASKLGVETSGLCRRRLRKHPSLKSEHDNPLLRRSSDSIREMYPYERPGEERPGCDRPNLGLADD
jgi:hypothetical protein